MMQCTAEDYNLGIEQTTSMDMDSPYIVSFMRASKQVRTKMLFTFHPYCACCSVPPLASASRPIIYQRASAAATATTAAAAVAAGSEMS